MKKRTINIITNILAILSWCGALILPFTFYYKSIWQVLAMALLGYAALKFKNDTMERLIDKILNIKG